MLEIPNEIQIYYYLKKEEIKRISLNNKGDFLRIYRDGIYDIWHKTQRRWELFRKNIISYSISPRSIISFLYKQDEQIRLLVYAKYEHSKTNNTLVAGLNLNKLDNEEIKELSEHIDEIISNDTPSMMITESEILIPDIFRKSYRTFDEKYIQNLSEE